MAGSALAPIQIGGCGFCSGLVGAEAPCRVKCDPAMFTTLRFLRFAIASFISLALLSPHGARAEDYTIRTFKKIQLTDQFWSGGLELDREFFVDFKSSGHAAHQIRLEGGDCSTDSFCYPSA